MGMRLTHSFTVPASIDTAWATFMDLERVGGCFPGATVTEVTDDGFSGTVKVKLGPIALVYAGSGSFIERDDAAHHAVIDAKGKDKRGNGTAGATVTIQLSEGNGGTLVDVATDLQVTGKPAQFGRGVMQDVSDKLLAAFVECIEARLDEANAQADASESEGETADEKAVENAEAELAAVEPDAAEAAPHIESAPPIQHESVSPATKPAPLRAAGPVRTPAARPAPVVDDAIDLGSVAGPVLAQRYAGFAAAGVIGLVLGWLFGRLGRRSR